MVKLLAKLKAVFVTCFWMVTTHELSNKQVCLRQACGLLCNLDAAALLPIKSCKLLVVQFACTRESKTSSASTFMLGCPLERLLSC